MPAEKLEGIVHIVEEAETGLNTPENEARGDKQGSEEELSEVYIPPLLFPLIWVDLKYMYIYTY